MLIKFILV